MGGPSLFGRILAHLTSPRLSDPTPVGKGRRDPVLADGRGPLALVVAEAATRLRSARDAERTGFLAKGTNRRDRELLIDRVQTLIDTIILPAAEDARRQVAAVGTVRPGENVARLHDLPYVEIVYNSLDISPGSPHAAMGFRFPLDRTIVAARMFFQPVRHSFVSLHGLDEFSRPFVAGLFDDFLRRAISGEPDRAPDGPSADARNP